MVSPDDNPGNFAEIFTVDKIDFIYQNVANAREYLDIPFGIDVYDSLTAIGESIIEKDGKIWMLKPYGNNRNLTEDYLIEGLYEFKSVPRTIPFNGDSLNVRDYSFRLINNKSGEYKDCSFVAVVASDFGYPRHGVPALTSSPLSNMISVTGIDENILLPGEPVLYQNYPNPFNPETNISFSLSRKGNVELTLYNSLGQEVLNLLNKEMDKGFHTLNLKAIDLNSGVYFYTLKVEGKKFTKKLVMLK
jgi:hypothetical protein